MGALSTLWSEMGALTFVGTLWAEMGALSALWAEMGALTFVGTLWTEMGALSTLWAKVIQNLPKRVIYFHADVYLRGCTKSTGEIIVLKC